MKTISFFALLFAFVLPFTVNAADICVNENGNGGCYSTITAAMSAASNGDRILITPKTGGAPYVENLTVNKSLQFLCAVDTGKYFVQGAISVVPAIGRTITFIGLKQLGNFSASSASPAGARCVVTILGSEITGDINFDYDNYNFTLAASQITGGVGFRFGKVIGNTVTCTLGYYGVYYDAIYAGNDATATNDTNLIVGNRVTYNPNSSYFGTGIEVNTQSQYFYIANNLITINGPSYTGYICGIRIYQYKNSAVSRNFVMNNTVTSAYNVYGGIYFHNAPVNSYTDVYNNLLILSSATYGSVSGGIGTIGVNYTVSNVAMNNTYDNGTNIINSGTTLDVTGRPVVGSDAINGGSPDFSYYDIDLTVNDAGAYGGSFTLDNFFPINSSARVYMVNVPRRMNVSGTINIKADGFDR